MTAGVALVALALPLSIAGVNVALGVLSAFVLIEAREARSWRSLSNPVFYALLAYCAAGLLSAALGVDPRASLGQWNKDFHKLWAATLLLVALKEENAPPAVAAALFAGFAIAALAGVLQSAAAASEAAQARWIRAHGFVHPVTFGGQLVFALLGCASFLVRTPKDLEGWRRPVGVLTALMAAALVLSQTRAAALALLAGAAALALAERRGRPLLAAAALAVGALAVLWELAPTGGRTLSAVLAKTAGGAAANPQQTRWVLWDVAWRMFQDHPLTGVGPGGYRAAFASYFDGALEGERVWGSAHNLYLHQLAERGLVGIAALAAVFGTIVGRLLRAERRAGSPWTLWALSSWATFLVLNITETAFQTEQMATLALFAWACAEGERSRGTRA